jgi:predicted RNA binding protein YcfA (HicA-like mRNA interferase family)
VSPKLPALSGKELVRALGRLGFDVARVRGSHHFLRHPDGRATVVPVHGKETIGPGLLGKILHDSRITRGDLARALDR